VFRAFTPKGVPYIFSLLDSPAVLNKGMIALTKHPNTPLLLNASIGRQLGNTPYFEGDLVKIGKSIKGYLVFREGWKYVDAVTGAINPLHSEIPYNFESVSSYNGVFKVKPYADPIVFYCDKTMFSYRRIVEVSDRIYLSKDASVSLDILPTFILNGSLQPIGIKYHNRKFVLRGYEIKEVL